MYCSLCLFYFFPSLFGEALLVTPALQIARVLLLGSLPYNYIMGFKHGQHYELCKKCWNPRVTNHSRKLDPWVMEDCTGEISFYPPKREPEPETKRESIMGDIVSLSCKCWKFDVTYDSCVYTNTWHVYFSSRPTDPLLRKPHYLSSLHYWFLYLDIHSPSERTAL